MVTVVVLVVYFVAVVMVHFVLVLLDVFVTGFVFVFIIISSSLGVSLPYRFKLCVQPLLFCYNLRNMVSLNLHFTPFQNTKTDTYTDIETMQNTALSFSEGSGHCGATSSHH